MTKTITILGTDYHLRPLTVGELRRQRDPDHPPTVDQIVGWVVGDDALPDALPMTVVNTLFDEVMALTEGTEELEGN